MNHKITMNDTLEIKLVFEDKIETIKLSYQDLIFELIYGRDRSYPQEQGRPDVHRILLSLKEEMYKDINFVKGTKQVQNEAHQLIKKLKWRFKVIVNGKYPRGKEHLTKDEYLKEVESIEHDIKSYLRMIEDLKQSGAQIPVPDPEKHHELQQYFFRVRSALVEKIPDEQTINLDDFDVTTAFSNFETQLNRSKKLELLMDELDRAFSEGIIWITKKE